MGIREIREKINLAIYDSKSKVLRTFKIITLIISIFAFLLMIYFYGFPLSINSRESIFFLIKLCFSYYVFHYLLRIFYSFKPGEFIKKNWFEGILMAFIVVDAISYYIFGLPLLQTISKKIGINNFTDFYIIITQLYLLTIIFLEFAKASVYISIMNLKASTLLILSFIILILMGTVLLMLPEMTVQKGSMPFLDALFTSISASCVTGLIVVDTATYFTFKGKLVLTLLMQAGGVNIITFATFFAALSASKVGVKHRGLFKDFIDLIPTGSILGLLSQVIIMIILFETAGALLIYILLPSELTFSSLGDKIFFSIFHSVSAFNNAGFSLFTNGFYENIIRNSFLLHLVIAALIFFGGLGFPAIKDLFGLKQIRYRFKRPWAKLQVSTRIAIYMSIILIVLGTFVFYFIEKNNSIKGYNIVPAFITSLFQSITTRTAGFNTVNISILNTPVLIFMIFLMFIGASSGSTGGGIKTSTFTILILSSIAAIRGKKDIEIFKHSIAKELVYRAFSIFLFASGVVFIGTFLLSITDGDKNILSLVFEEVSAFATVGLSTGITPDLSLAGKIIIMISMFVGRVGILTFAFAISKKTLTTRYKYPEAKIMVG